MSTPRPRPSLPLRTALNASGVRPFPRPLRLSLGARALARPAVALALLVALGACRTASPEPAASEQAAQPGLTLPASLGGTAAGKDAAGKGAAVDSAGAQAAIEAAWAKLEARGSYQVSMSAGEIRTKAWVQLPDRLRIEAEGLGQVLVIGQDTYSESQGQWSRISTSASLGEGLRQFIPDLTALVSEARLQGEETIDGQACAVYVFNSEQDLGGGKVEATVTLWVDKASGLPRRQTVVSQDPNLAGTLSSDFSYPPDISIEAPATYTDLGAGPGAAGAQGSAERMTPARPSTEEPPAADR